MAHTKYKDKSIIDIFEIRDGLETKTVLEFIKFGRFKLLGIINPKSFRTTKGLCAGVALEFLPPETAARLLIKINV